MRLASMEVRIREYDNPLIRGFQFPSPPGHNGGADLKYLTKLWTEDRQFLFICNGWVKAVCSAFSSFPGIVQFNLYDESLNVEIGRAFAWEEIEPKVVESIQAASLKRAPNQLILSASPNNAPEIAAERVTARMRRFHTRRKISEIYIKHFFAALIREHRNSNPEIGPTGTTVIKAVAGITPVSEVSIEKYSLDVILSRHRWTQNLQNQVVEAIRASLVAT